MTPSLVIRCGLLGACLLFSSLAQADIYKWTDNNGKVHYSETPPTETKAESIGDKIRMYAGKGNNSTSNSKSTASSEEKKVNPELDLKGPPMDLEKAKELGKKNALKHEDFCNEQKNALAQLLANPVINWRDATGEHLLSSQERDSKIKEAESTVAKLCNSDLMGKTDSSSATASSNSSSNSPTPSSSNNSNKKSE